MGHIWWIDAFLRQAAKNSAFQELLREGQSGGCEAFVGVERGWPVLEGRGDRQDVGEHTVRSPEVFSVRQ